MDISNGMIIRKTDWQIQQDKLKENEKTYRFYNDIDIEEFNKKQMNTNNQSLLYRDFEYNSSCDYYK